MKESYIQEKIKGEIPFPKFMPSKRPYIDLLTMTIHAKEKYSQQYFHEYTHAELLARKGYIKFLQFKDYYREFVDVVFSVTLILFIFGGMSVSSTDGIMYLLGIFATAYFLPAYHTFLEEIYCDIRGIILRYRFKKYFGGECRA